MSKVRSPYEILGKVLVKKSSSFDSRFSPLARMSCTELNEHKQAIARTLNCLLLDTLMFRRDWRDPFALKIACSDIPSQLSMFNVSRCLATPTNLRKSLDEIAVLFRLIHVMLTKNRSGTFRYNFPVSAKWICSQLCSSWAVDLRPWKRNFHQARQTDATLTRSSGSRYSNISGQKKRFSIIFTPAPWVRRFQITMWFRCGCDWNHSVLIVMREKLWCAKHCHLLIGRILCRVSGWLLLSLFISKRSKTNKLLSRFISKTVGCTKWIKGKLLKLTVFFNFDQY